MSKIDMLTRRRELLVMRASSQRAMVADTFNQWHKPLGILNQGLAVINYIKSKPMLSIGLATAFLLIKPKGKIAVIAVVGRKLWVGWKIYQSWKGSKKQN